MALSQKLSARLSQKLILTPSLQQAIKLLPMTTVELSELLTQEMVENPLLEEALAETPNAEPQEAEAEAAEKKAEEKGDTWDDADYEYFFGEYLDDGYRPKQAVEVRELPPIENTLSSRGSLADHLMWQLDLQTTDQTAALKVFGRMGFQREARLRNQVMDRDAGLHDLQIMSLDVDEFQARIDVILLSAQSEFMGI